MSDGERRLAAIMYTDMVGFTALGQRNESLSLALVKEQRKIIRPILVRHLGKEIKTMGDAFLVEFPNALDAMRCAYDIQRATREFNISLPEEKRIHLRLGLHLGDVVESQGDISGDAVNMASRIYPLAEDGGVCLTRPVYDSTHNKLDVQLISIGMKSLKNVSEPMEVYRMEMPWEKENVEPALQLDPRRVAVLPFVSMSPDPNDEFFADGMTEELITRISLVRGLEVIARTSVMGFKKKDKKASEIGRELKVGTLLEGSVRKAGNRIRVSAQLINANTEGHLWAQNFDRNLEDIFAVQDEVAEKVALSLTNGIFSHTGRRDTEDIEAYTMYLRAMQLINQHTEPDIKEAVTLLEGAISRDSRFVRAHAGLAEAWGHLSEFEDVDDSVARGKVDAEALRALELGPEWAEAHAAMSVAYFAADRFSDASREAEAAINLNPNLSGPYTTLGSVHAFTGRLDKAVELYARARNLDPLSFTAMNNLAAFYMFDGKLDEAWSVLERNKELFPTNPYPWIHLAYWYMLKRDYVKAQESLDVGQRIDPKEPNLAIQQGVLYALTNRREDAEKQLSVVESYKESFRISGELAIQNALGNYDEAFEALMRAAETHQSDVFLVKIDPFFTEMRKDPRFAEFCEKVGIPP